MVQSICTIYCQTDWVGLDFCSIFSNSDGINILICQSAWLTLYCYSINIQYLPLYKKTIDTLHKLALLKELAVHGGLYQNIFIKSWLEEKMWYEKLHKQELWSLLRGDYQAKRIQKLGRVSQGVDWGWSEWIKNRHA